MLDGDDKRPSITLATSTTVSRLSNFQRVDYEGAVEELLLVQGSVESHSADCTDLGADLRVVYLEDFGVAKSRNQAIHECETELLIFSDDDTVVRKESVLEVQREFEESPDIDFLLLRSADFSGRLRKRYPRSGRRASLFNSGRYGTIELAVRAGRVKQAGVEFDIRFGAGAEWPLGDEYLFIAAMLRHSLKGRHSSIVIASHDKFSSGLIASPEMMESRRQVFRCVFPVSHRILYPLSRLRTRLRSVSERFLEALR